MTTANDCHHLALPEGALALPMMDTSRIQNWIDYGLWGHLFYDDQSPWLTLIECLHILHYRKSVSDCALFEPPVVGLDGRLQHEQIAYSVPLNFHLRHLLFRDHGIESIAALATRDNLSSEEQWRRLVDHTRQNWNDTETKMKLDVEYLRDRFEDVRSLQRALDVLRLTEVEPYNTKRWTSRHVLPLGSHMLFADIRERSYLGDRRFMRRTGEILYLMLGRSTSRLLGKLIDVIEDRLVSGHALWNRLAKLLRSPSEDPLESVQFKTGYLPFAQMEVYDHLAEDWIALLSLERRDILDSLDALMRVSALHQVIYILHRAHHTRGRTGYEFAPFVFDLAASAWKNPVQRISLGQFDSHMKLPKHAIDACIEQFAGSPCWREIEANGSPTKRANKLLSDMWLWPNGRNACNARGTPRERLEKFRTDSISARSHSIWSVIANHTRGSGLTEARPGVGTWYAPSDEMLEALVLANVTRPMEFGEFLRTLYKRYRIVVGQEHAQQSFPGGAMPLEQFKNNEHLLEERLRVLRFVDRKSDACAFVVNPFYETNSLA